MKKSVIFVEDDELTRLMIVRLFSRRGVAVVLSSSGADALEKIRTLAADQGAELDLMFITDGHLPDYTGDDLIGAMHALVGERLACAVLLTADTERFKARAESVGYQLIAKSFDNVELLGSLDRFLAATAPAG